MVSAETAGNFDVLTETGKQTLAKVYKKVKEISPETECWLEEVDVRDGILRGSFLEFDIPKEKGWLGWLTDQGVKVDAYNIHAQGGLLLTPPERQVKIWDLIDEKFQTGIQYTRMHVNIPNKSSEEQQAYQKDMFRDSLILAFSHPAVNGVEFAGFWAGDHPFPSSAFWDEGWKVTELGQIYLDLVYKQWWTDEKALTGSDGSVTIPAFHGHYEIRHVQENGLKIRKRIVLTDDGEDVVLQLR